MIFRDVNGIGIVIVNGEMFLTNTIVKKKFLHPKELDITTTNSNVLDLNSRERYRILLLAHPRDEIVP